MFLGLALCLSLAACSEKSKGPEPGTPLNSFYEAVLAAQPEDAEALILFEESNPALINSFYPGLEDIELNQQAFYMPPIATHPCEIVLVEVKDSANVQAVAEIFQARIDMRQTIRLTPKALPAGNCMRRYTKAETLSV